MAHNGFPKGIGHPPSWIFKNKFLMGGALEKHVLHYHAKFCEARCCCRDIVIFRVFK